MTAPPDRPLDGRRVLVLRAPAQAAALSARIRALGGEPVEAPVLRFEPGDHHRMVAAARELAAGRFAVLCLTSPNGAEALARALRDAGVDAGSAAGGTLVACVGPGTAAALTASLGIEADLVPDRATTEALGHAIPPGRGRALLARADIANPVLSQLLAAKGYEPVEVTAYRTRTAAALPDQVLADLADGRLDLVAFGSSSTVRAFADLVGDRPWRAAVVSIGPVTSATCRELGIDVAVEADQHDLDGLVTALVRAAA